MRHKYNTNSTTSFLSDATYINLTLSATILGYIFAFYSLSCTYLWKPQDISKSHVNTKTDFGHSRSPTLKSVKSESGTTYYHVVLLALSLKVPKISSTMLCIVTIYWHAIKRQRLKKNISSAHYAILMWQFSFTVKKLLPFPYICSYITA